MKNYLLVLLSVIGIYIFANNAIGADIPTEVSSNFNPMPEVISLPTLDNYSGTVIDEVATSPKITSSNFSTTSIKKSTSRSSIPNYTVTATSDSIVKNPGSSIYRTKQILYAHNSSNLLGSIRNFGIGTNFTVTENGTTKTYEVAEIKIFKKVDNYTLQLCSLADYNACYEDSYYYMNTLQNAKFNGKTYNIAMMTCDGTSLGGGDATHRRVIFAYQK